MITYNITGGITDFSVVVRMVDSTAGTPNVSCSPSTAGLALGYRRELGTATAITAATLASVVSAHSDGGFIHIATGYYRLDLPDAAVAAGANGCVVYAGATSIIGMGAYIQLIPVTANVTQWLGTAAATPTTAGVPEVDITYWSGTAVATPDTAGYPKVTIKSGTGTGELNISSGIVDADVQEIDADATCATNLQRATAAVVRGVVTTGASTTSIPTSSLSPAATATDQFKGRIVTFDKDTTTAALRGQATDITASSSGGTLTVTALTTGPASGDTFTIT